MYWLRKICIQKILDSGQEVFITRGTLISRKKRLLVIALRRCLLMQSGRGLGASPALGHGSAGAARAGFRM